MTEMPDDKTYALFSTPNNKKIIADLEARNKKFIKFPAVETQKFDLDEATLENLLNIKQFDWIIFTDVLTADYFLQILEENEVDLFELDEVRICAYGEAVSDRLRFVQIHTDVLPNQIEDTEIIEAIKNYVNSEIGLREQNILLLHRQNTKISIAETLIAEGANVLELEIYQMSSDYKQEFPKLRALINGGAIDEFIFSAPEDLIYLKFIINTETINADLFEQFSITNETTFKTLFELGIKSKLWF